MAAHREHRMRVAGGRLRVTSHAVERYIERVKPHFTYEQAVEELERVLPFADMTRDLPWTGISNGEQDCWAALDGIAFPVVRGVLTTCVSRASVGAQVRIVRTERKHKPRPQTKRKKQHGKVARSERRRARDQREAATDEFR